MIQNNSLIVSLSISKWTARKHDKKITDEVRDQHNASQDAGRYNKLLAAKQFLEPISKIESEARTYHYEHTLPWGDNNERLLSSDLFFEFETQMLKFKGEYEVAIGHFFDNYDAVIADAKVRLNGMFREQDYPNKSEILEKFAFKVSFMPVPESDFRIKLTDEEVARLKSSVETEITTRMNDAVKDIWRRVKDQLLHMRERLSDPKAVFRDSLFDNLKELIHLLPKLNVTGDHSISEACNDMTKLLASPEAIRTNSNLRNQKAEEVQEVLNKFNTFFS